MPAVTLTAARNGGILRITKSRALGPDLHQLERASLACFTRIVALQALNAHAPPERSGIRQPL